MKTKLFVFIAFFLCSLSSIAAQEWSPFPATTTQPIERSGPITVGNIINPPLANPDIPIEARGTNILLQLPNDNTDFVALGTSGGPTGVDCDLWGLRAQRESDRSVNLGITPFGDDRAMLNYGAGIERLSITTGTDQRCGAELVSFFPTVTVFNTSVVCRFGCFQPFAGGGRSIRQQIEDPIERLLGLESFTNQLSFEKLNSGMNFASEGEFSIDLNSLKAFTPEVVATSQEGEDLVDYTKLIPVLVAGVQEQQEIIDQQMVLLLSMMDRLEHLEERLANSNTSEINQSGFLRQNTPNPARNQTEVNYQLPENGQEAVLIVRDLMGKVMYNQDIPNKTGTVSIDLTQFPSGSYIYTLVVDGEITASKRLMVQ